MVTGSCTVMAVDIELSLQVAFRVVDRLGDISRSVVMSDSLWNNNPGLILSCYGSDWE